MYTLHERPDEHFAAAYFGGVEEDYNVLKHTATEAINPNPDDDPAGAAATRASFADMLSRVRANMSSYANYQRVLEVLDIDAFIDYMIVNFYGGNSDWSHKNWYASENREDPDGRWRFHSWDAEHALDFTSPSGSNVTGNNQGSSPTEIHQRLRNNPEYRLLFADHIHKHFHNDGALTPANAAALYQARMTEIDRAIVGESARWGDNRRSGNAYTRANWLATQNVMLSSFFPGRTAWLEGTLLSQGLYTSIAPPDFRINGFAQFGGEVNAGDSLTIQRPGGSGTIYYTLDGSDPRLPGGAVNTASASAYGGAITLDYSVPVLARVRVGSEWSALSETIYHTSVPPTLAITEINYNPHEPLPDEVTAGFENGDLFEFVELQNVGTSDVSLETVHFANGIDFNFTGSDVTSLAPGEYVVVAKDQAAFEQRYGT
ncbi:MAG: CotH kinase family protein, partial [Candidatus Nealsonbacteria bacterium]|nr:CotH kinase family protein [Candidatus Nealsonbacteria bacterium]